MATIILSSNETFNVGTGSTATVIGNSGIEKVLVTTGATVTTDQSVERVDLGGAAASYTYNIAGNVIKVYSAGVLVETFTAGGTNQSLAFTDGLAVVAITGLNAATIGGQAVATAAASPTGAALPAAPTLATGAGNVSGVTAGGGTVTGAAYVLTTGTNIFALTAGNDTVTGASGTLATADAIIDTSTTDADVMTAQVSVATLAPTINNVETVTINGDFVTTGLDLTSVRGTQTLNFNTGIIAGTATVGTAVAGAGAQTAAAAKIAFGSKVTTATINADTTAGTAGQLVVDAGAVTALTLVGASVVDNYAITTNGNLAFTGSNTAETLKLTPTVADKSITLDSIFVTGNTIDVAGTVTATLKGTVANLTGQVVTHTGTGALTVEVATTGAAAVNLSKVAANAVTLSVAIGAFAVTVKTGTPISTSLDMGDAAFSVASAAATATTNAVTFNNTASTQTGLVGTAIKTLTVNSAASQVIGVDATYAVLDNGTNNVVLTGTNDVAVTLGTAKSVDASALVGALTYIQATTAATTIKGGSGANVITLANIAVDASYVGKDAGDTITTVNTTGAVSITTGAGIDTITATAAIAGAGALSVNTGAGADVISATALTTGVLSAILGDGNDTVTLGVGVSGTAVIVIDGGLGTDVLKVGPAFDISGGTLSLTSVESIELTATGALTFSAAQLSGSTIAIKGTATATDNLLITGVAGTTTLDASTLVIDQSLTTALSTTTLSAALSTGAATIKGTAVNDDITGGANGNTITPGAGADTITLGAGTDKVLYLATTGATLLTEAKGMLGSATTTPVIPATGIGAVGNGDIIATFTSGTDKIVLSTAFGTAGASGGLVAASGASYTAASTSLAAADFISGTTGAMVLTANTAGGGRFFFDATTNILYYDALGDTVSTAIAAVTAGGADDFAVVTVGVGSALVATDFAFA